MTSATDFAGLRVAALESRNREEMARLIERSHGLPYVSPSLREVPLEDHVAIVRFAQQLLTGELDMVIFLTGVGFKFLLSVVEKHFDRERYLNALRDCITVARGPKPSFAMKEVGITPTHRIPEPNTWRDLLKYLDQNVSLLNLSIGLQEYGKTNTSLIAGLEARGAQVNSLKVYQWELPEDTKPLADNVLAIAAGERDVLLVTSAHQLTNLLLMAEQLGVEQKLREALRRMVVASIGPTTSEALLDFDLPVDLEPEHPKMGPLVLAAAAKSNALIQQKRANFTDIGAIEIKRATSTESNSVLDRSAPWYDSPFMKACRREPVPYTPVWLMRQAGRYMAEYREVRAQSSFLELCKNPARCSEVMCTAVSRLGVDAAIIFSDLLPMLEPMGLDLEFAHGEGPVIHNPLREARDLGRFQELHDLSSLEFVMETVRLTRRDLPSNIPLIGFAGAPFTLASYAIEGGSSRNYLNTKNLMLSDPVAWREIMERLARSVARYLNAQIAAGAQYVQIFDSWVGCLGTDQYRRFVMPSMKLLFSLLTPGIPVIHFAHGNPVLLPLAAEAGGDVLGVDWRIRLDDAWRMIGEHRAVQGNLDPTVLLTNRDVIETHVRELLQQANNRAGHIFNLGHGVLQQTPVENAIAVVEIVHELSKR